MSIRCQLDAEIFWYKTKHSLRPKRHSLIAKTHLPPEYERVTLPFISLLPYEIQEVHVQLSPDSQCLESGSICQIISLKQRHLLNVSSSAWLIVFVHTHSSNNFTETAGCCLLSCRSVVCFLTLHVVVWLVFSWRMSLLGGSVVRSKYVVSTNWS